MLSLAANLHKHTGEVDVQASFVHRESVLLRTQNNISESQRVIRDFLDVSIPEVNPRLHSLLGLLHISQAQNWAYQFSHQAVYDEAQKWELQEQPSTMELYVLRSKLKVLALGYKGNGLFEDARSILEGCLGAMKPEDDERFLIQAQFADMCCEVQYSNCKALPAPDSRHLNEAEKVLAPEIERLRASSPRSSHFRRLGTSLVEIELCRGRPQAARCLLQELLPIYDKLQERDVNDQLGHIRLIIARARLSEPAEAVRWWQRALICNKKYNRCEKEVFTCGVIYLFLTLAHLKLRHFSESWLCFARAAHIIKNKERQFQIPGIGTYLYDFARQTISSVLGWQLPAYSPK